MGKGNTSRRMQQKISHRKYHARKKRHAKGDIGPRPQVKEISAASFVPKPPPDSSYFGRWRL